MNNAIIPQIPPSKGAWSWNSGVAITAGGAVSVIPMPGGGWVNDATHPDIMANGPMLTNGGVTPTATFNSIGSHCTSRNPRSAVGVTADNRLILVVVDGRTEDAAGMTCQELADLMLALGCPDSINMDGGGSTTLWGRGQLYNGVLNFPSDNGAYDHLGERACSNAVAVVAPTTAPLALDARITGITYSGMMTGGTSQTVTITYQNVGTQSWSSANTHLLTSRPDNRASDFRTTASWISDHEPAALSPATVAAGASGSFTFVVTAPQVPGTAIFDEYFNLVRDGVGRFGPANNEARMKFAVSPPSSGQGDSFLVESRLGGQNYAWYSDSGMADTSVNCTATSATATIGMRYGSTYRSVAGAKSATWAPQFPASGYYRVYVAWGSGSNRRNPITYRVNHAAGTEHLPARPVIRGQHLVPARRGHLPVRHRRRGHRPDDQREHRRQRQHVRRPRHVRVRRAPLVTESSATGCSTDARGAAAMTRRREFPLHQLRAIHRQGHAFNRIQDRRVGEETASAHPQFHEGACLSRGVTILPRVRPVVAALSSPRSRRRAYAQCPMCGALNATGSLAVSDEETGPVRRRSKKCCTFPREYLEPRFRKRLGTGSTADLSSPLAMVKPDITNMQFPDESFDAVYCSHVLDRVQDDRRAMRSASAC